ncbi:MAG: STAS domain-containing protein, partial [Roseimicrobium sp.]
AMNYRRCGASVCVGVGATIDFLAGAMKRAPRWMQVTGLEWTFRLAQEPRRLFKRYATDLFVFGTAILRQAWQLRRREPRTASFDLEQHTTRPNVLVLPARLDALEVQDQAATWEFWLAREGPLILDASAVTFVDSTGIGLLVRMRKHTRGRHRPLLLAGAPGTLRRPLELMKLDQAFTFSADVASAQTDAAELVAHQPFTVGELDFDSTSRIAWQHEITARHVDELWKVTETLLAGSELRGGSRVVIELSAVTFIDSAGIGLMIRVKKHAKIRQVEVAFANATDRISKVLSIVRLEKYLLDTTTA